MEGLERVPDALDAVEALLLGLAEEGLERLEHARLAEIEEVARGAHRARLVRIERELQALASLGRRWLDRDPTFRVAAWRAGAGRVFGLARAARGVLAGDGDPDGVLGVARRKYEPIPGTLEVHALGASGWVTESGFVGLTAHLAAPALGRVLEASVARPVAMFGDDPRRLLFQPVSEVVGLSFQELSHGAWTLDDVRLSSDGRLSLHAGLVASPAPPIGRRAYEAVAVVGVAGLLDRLAPSVLDPLGGEGRALAWLDGARVERVGVDETRARITVQVRDRGGATVRCSLPSRPEHDRWVENLRRLAAGTPRTLGLLGSASFTGGELSFQPITAVLEAPARLAFRRGGPVQELHLGLEPLAGPAEDP